MAQHGSLQNMLAAPVGDTLNIGDGATIISWTDRTACTVIDVLVTAKGAIKGYVLQADIARRTDGYGMSDAQSYAYERDPEGTTYEARVVRQGRAKGNVKVGDRKVIAGRHHYHDYSF